MPNIIQGSIPKFISAPFGEMAKAGAPGEYRIGSAKEITHDGDTLKISARGNFSVRFLGIDTPEISMSIRRGKRFFGTGSAAWQEYLDNIRHSWGKMEAVLGSSLYAYISEKLDQGEAALNQHIHAKRAEDKLEQLLEADMKLLGLNKNNMLLFVPFSYEITDSNGRLLSFVHPDTRNPAITIPDPPRLLPSYNERMLESGYTLPYFIWPNVNPFRTASSVTGGVYASVEEFRKKVQRDRALNRARQYVKAARQNRLGVFESGFQYQQHTQVGPLLLEAFELRYLSRQAAPDRHFIDLSAQDNIIHPPLEYHRFLPEDRLFIPPHFIPLFEKRGWESIA